MENYIFTNFSGTAGVFCNSMCSIHQFDILVTYIKICELSSFVETSI